MAMIVMLMMMIALTVTQIAVTGGSIRSVAGSSTYNIIWLPQLLELMEH